MSNQNQNRYTRRQEQRRSIDERIRCRGHGQKALTNEEVVSLIESINKNRVADFGLKKIYNSNINERYAVILHRDGVERTVHRTLLHRAIELNRDKIVMALLRAGANPCIFPVYGESIVDDELSVGGEYLQLLVDVPLPYLAWLVRYAFQHGQNNSNVCTTCKSKQPYTILFDKCGHFLCNHCFWTDIAGLDCANRMSSEGGTESFGSFVHLLQPHICCAYCRVASQLDQAPIIPLREFDNCLTPTEVCSKSFQRFVQLPKSRNELSVFNTAQQKQPISIPIEANSNGIAMHLSGLALLNLGVTQEQRCDELQKAVYRDDVRRISALVYFGVDLEHKDEYGLTALLLAAWLGHVRTVRLLLLTGANPVTTDPLGHNAQTIAQFNNNFAKAKYLAQATEVNSTTLATCDYFDNCYAIADGTFTVLIPRISDSPQYWQNGGVRGAETGAYCLDNCFSPDFLHRLVEVFESVPVALAEKDKCAARSYFCDVSAEFTSTIESVLQTVLKLGSDVDKSGSGESEDSGDRSGSSGDSVNSVVVFPQLRFLHYSVEGSALAPHVDLPRVDVRKLGGTTTGCGGKIPGATSTHTLILYLTDCSEGGETVLLRSLPKPQKQQKDGEVKKEDEKEAQVKEWDERGQIVAKINPRKGRLLLFPHNCPHAGGAVFAEFPKILLRGEVYMPQD